MAGEQKNLNNNNNNNKSSSLNSSSSSSSGEIIGGKGGGGGSTSSFSGKKPHYPNQREASIPDAATLRDQWKFAIRQYSKWNSHAWGAVIFAGVSFYALGWIIKGSNPIPSTSSSSSSSRKQQPQQQDQEDDHK